jgi:hypothetical protein
MTSFSCLPATRISNCHRKCLVLSKGTVAHNTSYQYDPRVGVATASSLCEPTKIKLTFKEKSIAYVFNLGFDKPRGRWLASPERARAR